MPAMETLAALRARLRNSSVLHGTRMPPVWRIWELIRRLRPCVCVALLDLDLFKKVNDRCGACGGRRGSPHAWRDRLTSRCPRRDIIAHRGRRRVRRDLQCSRSASSGEGSRTHPQSVAHEWRSGRIEVASHRQRGYVTVHAGIQLSPQQAMAAADRFSRQAKEQGRDRTLGGPYAGG